MNRFRNLLLLLPVVALLAAGCEETPADPNASKTDLLTAKSWTTSSYSVNDEPMEVSAAPIQAATFKSDKTVSATVAGTTVAGTWSFNVDETNLVTTIGGVEYNWNLNTLTSSRLVLRANQSGTTMELEMR